MTREGAGHAVGFGALWAAGVECIAQALARYDANVSQLVPLYNLNALVAVGVGLTALWEWQSVEPWQVLAGAVLAAADGVLG